MIRFLKSSFGWVEKVIAKILSERIRRASFRAFSLWGVAIMRRIKDSRGSFLINALKIMIFRTLHQAKRTNGVMRLQGTALSTDLFDSESYHGTGLVSKLFPNMRFAALRMRRRVPTRRRQWGMHKNGQLPKRTTEWDQRHGRYPDSSANGD